MQANQNGAQIVVPVESELHLRQVAVGALGEVNGVVSPGGCCLDVADEGIDGLELHLEHAGLSAASDLAVVHGASAGGDVESAQNVGDQGQRKCCMSDHEVLHGRVGEHTR